ncbi:hypothetical protein [Thermococcus sp.]|uniref:hypothetical protein n=1 Tax=Thermococcus sp. TaxID=35749 RepID=UPI0025DBC87D|nr:hypothetical protein [Thermococcus sp.]
MRGLLVLIILLALVTSSTAIAVPGTAYLIDSQVNVEINPNSELLGIVYYLAFGKNDPFVIDRESYFFFSKPRPSGRGCNKPPNEPLCEKPFTEKLMNQTILMLSGVD